MELDIKKSTFRRPRIEKVKKESQNTEVEIQILSFEYNEELWIEKEMFCKAIGYADSSVSSIIRKNMLKDKKSKLDIIEDIINDKVNYDRNYERTKFINRRLASIIICRTRLITCEFSEKLCNLLGLNCFVILDSHEQNTILNLMYMLQQFTKAEREFKPFENVAEINDDCRIDLYLPDLKVAIECDENDHADREDGYDDDRELFIKQHLGCSFVRFNPDASDFNRFIMFGTVLKEIMIKIKEYKNKDDILNKFYL